jgi:histidyl-tRNA synthetase
MGRLKLSRLKGMRDLLPAEAERWAAVEDAARRTFSSYGYGQIRTPILEPTELFARSVGETTDIVHKEMFTFTDRGGRSVTLRPENTAGVVRAIIENGLAQGPMPLRLFYVGPQYRYERPQKGRYREFNQIGVELFGVAGPAGDFEVLAMLFDFLRTLGFDNLEVALNAVPTGDGRARFTEALRSYAEPRGAGFGEDDRRRLNENPLRLFDSKDPETLRVLEGAPRAADFLESDSQEHHQEVRRLLDEAGIPNRENPALVRGLDYYTKSVFEVTSSDLGAQDAILGGGRYDGLVSDLGGPRIPAVGFAIGEDRLVDVAPRDLRNPRDLYLVLPEHADLAGEAIKVAAAVRLTFPSALVETDLNARGWDRSLSRGDLLLMMEEQRRGRASEVEAQRLTMKVSPHFAAIDSLFAVLVPRQFPSNHKVRIKKMERDERKSGQVEAELPGMAIAVERLKAGAPQ